MTSRSLLPPAAVLLLAAGLAIVLGAAGPTLGWDFEAYRQAAARILSGEPLYDRSLAAAGPYGAYLYPPPFALALIPFALVPFPVALAVWLAIAVAALVAAVALMPVAASTRWVVLLLAGIDWPVLYAIKLGQVGPLLLLLLVVAWRSVGGRERPAGVATFAGAVALGGLMKLQPGLLAGWALLVGRARAGVVAIAAGAILAAASVPFVGVAAWADFVAVILRVSDPVATPAVVTPAAVLYRAGLPMSAAWLIHWATAGGILLTVVLAARRRSAATSVVVAAVATQVISPVIWDHYAIVLLLPLAWLLDRGHRWAIAIPMAPWLVVLGVVPDALYPLLFAAGLLAPLLVGGSPARVSADPVLSSPA